MWFDYFNQDYIDFLKSENKGNSSPYYKPPKRKLKRGKKKKGNKHGK